MILRAGVLAVALSIYARENGGEQLSDFEFITVLSVFCLFEFEFDAQLFLSVGRSLAFGFHLERWLRGRMSLPAVLSTASIIARYKLSRRKQGGC